MNSFLDCVAGSEKNAVFDHVKSFVMVNSSLPVYDEICANLVSPDLEENMNALEFVLENVLFGKIVLGCDVENPRDFLERWDFEKSQSADDKFSYYDFDSIYPALTADTIQEFAAVISGLIELETLMEE